MSFNPKTIYIAQRTIDGLSWEESYVSGSNLILQTDSTGSVVGLQTLPIGYSVISSSYATTASYVLNAVGSTTPTGGFVVTASGAVSNQTASYATQALTASYALSATATLPANVISSSAQLSNDGGTAFTSSNNVTFGSVTASAAFLGNLVGTSSWSSNARTASYVTYDNLANKPTLVGGDGISISGSSPTQTISISSIPSAVETTQSNGIYDTDLVTNGTFTTDLSGWVGAGWSWSSSAAKHATGSEVDLNQPTTLATQNQTYKITYSVINPVGVGNIYVFFGGVFCPFRSTTGTYTDYITATSTGSLGIWVTTAFDGMVDSVSVSRLTNTGSILFDSAMELRKSLTVHDRIIFPQGRAISIGYKSLFNNSTGVYNIPSSNTAIGYQAGLNTTTGHITAVGYRAGENFTEGNLTAFGKWAGVYTTTGHATFFGNAAGLRNTISDSAAFGDEAGSTNQSGSLAVFGNYAGFSSTVDLTAVGHHALRYSTTGKSTGIGHQVGRSLTTGRMILLGYEAGYASETSASNAAVTDTGGILIGDNATRTVASGTQLDNYIGIGDRVEVTDSNSVVLGNKNVTKTTLRGAVGGPSSINVGEAGFDVNFPLRVLKSTNTFVYSDLVNSDTGSSAGSAFILGSSAGSMIIRNHSVSHSVWLGQTTISSPGNGSGFAFITPGTEDPIDFYTNNTIRAKIDNNNFFVYGTESSTTSTSGVVRIGNGSAATNVGIGGGNISAGGKIVIGNPSPSLGVRLEVYESSATVAFYARGAGQSNGVAIGSSGTNIGLINGYSTSSAVAPLALQLNGGNLTIGNSATVVTASGTSVSSGVGTGAWQFAGGMYVAGDSVFGSTVSFGGRLVNTAGGFTSNGALTLGSSYSSLGAGFQVDYSAPVTTQFFGDGTGYSMVWATRAASTTVARMTLTDTGVLTVSGAITLNSATSILSINSTDSDKPGYLTFRNSGSVVGFFGFSQTANSLIVGAGANDMILRTQGTAFRVSTDSGGTSALILSAAGALTIASSVTASAFTTTGNLTTGGGRKVATSIKTTTYTVTTSDHVLVGNHASTPFTITMIAASPNTGQQFIIKNKGVATVTVDATSLGTIDGSNTITLTTNQSATLVSDGAQWNRI